MDRYDSRDHYFKTKLNILNNNIAIYNNDDTELSEYFKSRKDSIPFSLNKKSQQLIIKQTKIYYIDKVKIIDQKDTKLLGNHNLYNIAASILISKHFNINNKMITSALKEFKPLKHRMEKISTKSIE